MQDVSAGTGLNSQKMLLPRATHVPSVSDHHFLDFHTELDSQSSQLRSLACTLTFPFRALTRQDLGPSSPRAAGDVNH